MGRALAQRLVACGHAVTAVLSRQARDAAALAEAVGAPVGSSDWADLPFDVSVVMLCVPDDALAAVARALAALPRPWSSVTVAHTSGAHPAAALAPLAAAGAATLSFHPMQTFAADSPPSAFADSYVGLEGDPEAMRIGAHLAEDMGAHPVTIPPGAKARYHLAAALASNGLVALMGVVNEIFAAAGIDPEEGAAMVKPLLQRTLDNVVDGSPDEALTGPAVRGDLGTVVAHLEALADHTPHLLPTYIALTNEMIRLGVRSGRLAASRAEPLLDALHDALQGREGPESPEGSAAAG